MKGEARRRIRISAALFGGALAALVFEPAWSTAAFALAALSGIYAAGRATREAAGLGYTLGAATVGAGSAALWMGPTHDWGFVAFAAGLALIGAWFAASAAPPLTEASAPAPRRRSA